MKANSFIQAILELMFIEDGEEDIPITITNELYDTLSDIMHWQKMKSKICLNHPNLITIQITCILSVFSMIKVSCLREINIYLLTYLICSKILR